MDDDQVLGMSDTLYGWEVVHTISKRHHRFLPRLRISHLKSRRTSTYIWINYTFLSRHRQSDTPLEGRRESRFILATMYLSEIKIVEFRQDINAARSGARALLPRDIVLDPEWRGGVGTMSDDRN